MSNVILVFIAFAFLFMICSMIGWLIELLFRRIFSIKKWINPGFLKGPYLPIYGIGVIVLFIYINLMNQLKVYFSSKIFFDAIIILGIGLLMTIVELIGGMIFIKGLKVRLWDYSNRWGNYKGIICPLFSLLWTIAGGLFYYILYNPISILVDNFISSDLFVIVVFIMGIFYGIFIIDFIYSIELVNKIKKIAEEKRLIVKWDNLKLKIKEELTKEKIKSYFLSPFKSPYSIKSHLEKYIEEKKNK